VLMVSKDGWFQPGVNAQSAVMTMLAPRMGGGGGSPGRDTGKGAAIVVSDPGEVIERTLELARGSSLSGTVTSPDGLPVSGAQVSLVPEVPRGGNDMARILGGLVGTPDPRLTDAKGNYELPGPPPGQQARVVARAAGWLDGRSDVVTCAAGDARPGVDV